MKRKPIQPSAPLPMASDKPLIPETEMERTIRTERTYQLPEDEYQAILAKYPILMPRNRPFGDKGVIHIPRRKGQGA